jgi:hypothetical protein
VSCRFENTVTSSQSAELRPEGQQGNSPGRQAGSEIGEKWSAESATPGGLKLVKGKAREGLLTILESLPTLSPAQFFTQQFEKSASKREYKFKG